MAKTGEVVFDISDWERYFELMDKASRGDLKKQIAIWFEALGFEFLSIVQDEIIRRKVVDTRLLLNSFSKGRKDNVWKTSDGGLTLEVGTNVKYAQFVNDGHWANTKGVYIRWIPGEFRGDSFYYKPGSKTGIALKQRWIEGSHYWEAAIRIFERIFKVSVEKKMEQWGKQYFR